MYGQHSNVHQSHDPGALRGVARGDGKLGVCVVRQAPVICVMAPSIHLGAWSMALMLWLLDTHLHTDHSCCEKCINNRVYFHHMRLITTLL